MASPPRLPPPVAELSLDEQIALAERQVIVRDARIRHRSDVLFRRVKHETIKHAGGGALLGPAAMALAWARTGSEVSRAAASEAAIRTRAWVMVPLGVGTGTAARPCGLIGKRHARQ